jgi:hypothetical protein
MIGMLKSIAAAVVALTIAAAPAAAVDWNAVAVDRIVGEAVRHVATTGAKLAPAAVAEEAKRRAAAEGVKLGKVDYDARIAGYLITENARKLKCAHDGLEGSTNDAIEKLTGEPKQQLAAEGVTLKVDWDKLGLDALEHYRETAGRRTVCR